MNDRIQLQLQFGYNTLIFINTIVDQLHEISLLLEPYSIKTDVGETFYQETLKQLWISSPTKHDLNNFICILTSFKNEFVKLDKCFFQPSNRRKKIK